MEPEPLRRHFCSAANENLTMGIRPFVILPALSFCLFWAALTTGCGASSPAGTDSGPSSLELTSLFSAPGAHLKGADANTFDPHFQVTRRGLTRDSMLLIPPATARAALPGVSGKYVLEAWCTQVFNTGDGIQMNLYLAQGGARSMVYNRYFDAGRRAEDRDWILVRLPLTLDSTKPSVLEIETSAGPQGDLTGDWLAVSSVKLLQQKEIR